MTIAVVIGTLIYHRLTNRRQLTQAKRLVLNGKSAKFDYPDYAFWEWNSPDLVSTSTPVHTVHKVGFPSVFQTSEHLRFDLVKRPRSVRGVKTPRLGIGHTDRVQKSLFIHVWSLACNGTETMYNKNMWSENDILSTFDPLIGAISDTTN